VTVDPNDKVAGGPKWFKTFVSVLMLLALLFEAFFTAGIVNRLIDRRLTGSPAAARCRAATTSSSSGLGQVGLRLCLLLRDCGIAVVAVDDEEGENVGQAREAACRSSSGAARTRRCSAPVDRPRARARRGHRRRPREPLDRDVRPLAQGRRARRAARRRRQARQRDPVAVQARDRPRRAPDRRALIAAQATGSEARASCAPRTGAPRARRRQGSRRAAIAAST
jgi:hypothetical protein